MEQCQDICWKNWQPERIGTYQPSLPESGNPSLPWVSQPWRQRTLGAKTRVGPNSLIIPQMGGNEMARDPESVTGYRLHSQQNAYGLLYHFSSLGRYFSLATIDHPRHFTFAAPIGPKVLPSATTSSAFIEEATTPFKTIIIIGSRFEPANMWLGTLSHDKKVAVRKSPIGRGANRRSPILRR